MWALPCHSDAGAWSPQASGPDLPEVQTPLALTLLGQPRRLHASPQPPSVASAPALAVAGWTHEPCMCTTADLLACEHTVTTAGSSAALQRLQAEQLIWPAFVLLSKCPPGRGHAAQRQSLRPACVPCIGSLHLAASPADTSSLTRAARDGGSPEANAKECMPLGRPVNDSQHKVSAGVYDWLYSLHAQCHLELCCCHAQRT